MPIIKEHNLLFIHIPKTGGSSIEHYFNIPQLSPLEYLWDTDINFNHELNIKYKQWLIGENDNMPLSVWNRDSIYFIPQHWPSKYIKEFIKNEYNKYFKFTFVRNPYTRIISEFFFNNPSNFSQNSPFQDMVKFNNWLPKFLSKIDYAHKLPQFSFLDKNINFIGKFENLNNDFNKLLKILNIPNKQPLLKLNTTSYNKHELIKYISRSNLDLINKIYQPDFVYFNYEMI